MKQIPKESKYETIDTMARSVYELLREYYALYDEWPLPPYSYLRSDQKDALYSALVRLVRDFKEKWN